MRKTSFVVMLAATVSISMMFWAICIALIAWGGCFSDRSPEQLRSYPNSCSVILAERWGSAPRVPAVCPAASGEEQGG